MQDYLPNSDEYFVPIEPMARSKPEIPIDEILEATTPEEPYPFDSKTDMPVGVGGGGGNLFTAIFSFLGKIKSIFFKWGVYL